MSDTSQNLESEMEASAGIINLGKTVTTTYILIYLHFRFYFSVLHGCIGRRYVFQQFCCPFGERQNGEILQNMPDIGLFIFRPRRDSYSINISQFVITSWVIDESLTCEIDGLRIISNVGRNQFKSFRKVPKLIYEAASVYFTKYALLVVISEYVSTQCECHTDPNFMKLEIFLTHISFHYNSHDDVQW